MDENLPILINFEVNENQIKLRLDNLGLLCFNSSEQAICELEVNNPQLERGITQLQEVNGQVFEFDIFQENNETIFKFWGDYGRVTEEIKCESVKENFSEYTTDDLVRKGSLLAELYSDIYKRFNENYAKHYTLTNKLKTEISNEITRFQRKAEFFESRNISKAEAFNAEINVLQKLMKIIEPNSRQ